MKHTPPRFLKSSAVALSLAAIAGVAVIVPAEAREVEAPGQAMLVLDASGSMWAEMQGPAGKTTRIETARSTVSEMLEELSPGTQLGLIAYGHRRKGDCKDIEVLIPPGSLDKDAFRSTVNKLKPKGMTPLTDAVRIAAEELRYTEHKATVILVTDGLETCAPDPCAAAASLEEAGIDFTAHVIGFGLSKEESAKVSCIAENTGGRYLDAKDGAGLSDALEQVVLEPVEPVEMEEPETSPWFPGEAFMQDVQLQPTGRETTGPAGNPNEDFAFPTDGTAEQCQAICEADANCGSWVYNPPGSYFIEEPRCRVYPSSSEMDYELTVPGDGWVSGMKPETRVLTREFSRAPKSE